MSINWGPHFFVPTGIIKKYSGNVVLRETFDEELLHKELEELGLPGKPVGLVYIALSARTYECVKHFVWDSDREGNKHHSSEAALAMLKEFLEQ
jgi:hypothetical protein